MRALILVAGASLALSACGSAPSENSTVDPAVVCTDTDSGNCVATENFVADNAVVADEVKAETNTTDVVVNK